MDMSLGKLCELVMDREAWHAVVSGVAKSRTRLSDWTELNWIQMYPSGYPQIIKLYLRRKCPIEGNFLLWSRGRKEVFCLSNNWVAFQSTKRNIRPGKKQYSWKRKQYLGIQGRCQRQGMFPGELKIESGCWSINLGLIKSHHWLDGITFFLYRCQVFTFGAGFFPPIFAGPGHHTKWDCHAGLCYKGAEEPRRHSVEGTFLPAQDEKDENDLTERNKMMITSKGLPLSNSKERFSLPSFYRKLFLLFTGFQEGDKWIDYSQRNGIRPSRQKKGRSYRLKVKRKLNQCVISTKALLVFKVLAFVLKQDQPSVSCCYFA